MKPHLFTPWSGGWLTESPSTASWVICAKIINLTLFGFRNKRLNVQVFVRKLWLPICISSRDVHSVYTGETRNGSLHDILIFWLSPLIVSLEAKDKENWFHNLQVTFIHFPNLGNFWIHFAVIVLISNDKAFWICHNSDSCLFSEAAVAKAPG